MYLPSGKKVTAYSGQLLTEFHVKPIHYVGSDGRWHNLDEIASYFGNRNGMVLKEGWEKRMNFSYLVWYMKRQQLINGRGVRIGYPSTYFGLPVGRVEWPMMLNAVTTVYPDPNPETTTVDGRVTRWTGLGTGYANWATMRDGTGTHIDDSSSPEYAFLTNDSTDDKYRSLLRSYFLFDTSSIPDGDNIDSAILSLYGNAKADALSITPDLNIYKPTTAFNTSLTTGDFDVGGWDATAYSTTITYAGFSTTAYNDFTLNASGLANISKTGVSKFGARNASYDVANSSYTITANATVNTSNLDIEFAEAAGTASDPKLAVTHSSATTVIPQLATLGVGV